LDIIGDEILRIFHAQGIQHEDVVVKSYAIMLKSGRCIELAEHEILATDCTRMVPDQAFDRFVGLEIIGVETNEYWPTVGIRLSNQSVLVMGSPLPYFWGLCAEED
jgi:hypothetical protein